MKINRVAWSIYTLFAAVIAVMLIYVYRPELIDPLRLTETIQGTVLAVEEGAAGDGELFREILVRVGSEGVFVVPSATKNVGENVTVNIYRREITGRKVYKLKSD